MSEETKVNDEKEPFDPAGVYPLMFYRPGSSAFMKTTGVKGIEVRISSVILREDHVQYEVAWITGQTRNTAIVEEHEIYGQTYDEKYVSWLPVESPQDTPEEPPPPPKKRVPGGYTAIDDAILLLQDLKDFCRGQGSMLRERDCKRTIAALQEMQKAEPPKPEISKSFHDAIEKAATMIHNSGDLQSLGRSINSHGYQRGLELIDLAAKLRQELSLVTKKD